MGIKCCKDCVSPKRHPKCHSHCEEYISEREELDKENMSMRAYREENRIMMSSINTLRNTKRKK